MIQDHTEASVSVRWCVFVPLSAPNGHVGIDVDLVCFSQPFQRWCGTWVIFIEASDVLLLREKGELVWISGEMRRHEMLSSPRFSEMNWGPELNCR